MEKKRFNKVRRINFEVIFEGYGCINFDSIEQVDFDTAIGLISKDNSNFYHNNKKLNNIKLAKKNIRINSDNKPEFHIKVSNETIKHNMFKKTMDKNSPNLMTVPHILYSALAHKDCILRGYLNTQRGDIVLKKSSPITITDAEEIGPWRSAISMDFHSRSGQKESKEGKGKYDPNDTSIYKDENVGGAITYKSEGAIDVNELRFISADPIYDRCAINVDGGSNESIYLDSLRKSMCNFSPEFKYYYLDGAITQDEWAERGILLNDDSVDMLIKRAFENILEIKDYRNKAYFKTKSLKVTVCCDGMAPETIDITLDNIDSFYFECLTTYVETNEEKILNNKKNAEEISAKIRKERKEKKEKEDRKGRNDLYRNTEDVCEKLF